ncbi:zinc finger CCCH domain-containing protein 30-like [Andrographis paniculata]|uniref:zinc finger CCCH domain-containing protein 30-like n=1 Tax=Andrographis paniculata TaxID=175694 RepID=UPI0021E91C86|nr:zinc finger CCCH domain-containing protein 30-like [Andrographis paniculata]
MSDTSKLTVEIQDSCSSLLEFAADNDAESFKRLIELDLSAIDEVGVWYVRKKGSRQIIQEERTPLMVAATYGSVDVLRLIVALPEVDLNRVCGSDKWTALHCAAFGGSLTAYDVVKMLLSAGADPNVEDAYGLRSVDVIEVPPKLPGARCALEDLLMNNTSDGSVGGCNLQVSLSTSSASSPVLSSSPESRSPCSPSDSVSSPMVRKGSEIPGNCISEKKQYPVDPSIPDIRNSIYATDEFRMYSFKIRPCSRAYSHDWTECPFVHPGENARRRDPRKYHYSCVPCPDFRKGTCRRGDMCEYAHGVFECWLHPAQYRTRLCKDGTSCARQVCFFAHTQQELRPLFVSTGSGVPSPRSAASAAGFMDMAAALSHFPGSPTSQSVISPGFNPTAMSPTANGMPHSSTGWPQPSVPALHLPGSNLQSSRLRSSLSARDIPPEDLNIIYDFDGQPMPQPQGLSDLACFLQSRPNPPVMLNHSGRSSKPMLTPSNLEDLFLSEITSSPRFSDQMAAASGVFSPTRKSAVLNQLQQQQINTNSFSPRGVEQHPLSQASFGIPSPRMSPRSLENPSPMSARLSAFPQHEQMQSLVHPWDLGPKRAPSMGSPVADWANNNKWGSPEAKVDWSLDRNRSLVNPNNNIDGDDAPDLSWVQSLVKESPPEMMDNKRPAAAAASSASGAAAAPSGECLKPNPPQTDSIDHSALSSWLEQMQLDQLVA